MKMKKFITMMLKLVSFDKSEYPYALIKYLDRILTKIKYTKAKMDPLKS